MDILAFGLSGLLAIIAAAHFGWAIGIVWPYENEKDLARAVVGTRGIKKMPPRFMSGLVAIIIILAACWPLMWRALIPYIVPQGMIWAGMLGITITFLVRGVAGYLPLVTGYQPTQPFARYNLYFYSPLCLAIAAAFALLLFYL